MKQLNKQFGSLFNIRNKADKISIKLSVCRWKEALFIVK